ncbi:odorant receptor coreceptor isoform X2 [Cephus cinctus]|uniref:Odorant receptor n=1 Tax=Cephus cinctus TaxID=211228 RepID=A0AAJ7BQD8_CEPCN|nr:odorant receptor coreceptor isoform X2 [Cephus cinctus]
MDYEYNPEEAFAINFGFLRVDGAWPTGITNPILRFLYRIYGFCVLSIFTVLYFSTEIILMTVIWGDVQAMVDCSFLFLTHLSHSVKLTNFLLRQKRLDRMIFQLREPMFVPKRPEHIAIMKAAVLNAERETKMFLTITFGTIICWSILPLLSQKEVKELPLMGWFPFDTTQSPAYGFTYTYQVISVLLNACVNAMMDTMTSGLLILMGAQLDMLKENLQSLTDDASTMSQAEMKYIQAVKMKPRGTMFIDIRQIQYDGKTDGSVEKIVKSKHEYGKLDLNRNFDTDNQFENVMRYEDILHIRVVTCAEHFKALVKYIYNVRDVFQIGIMAQFLASSIIICLTCFKLSLVSPASVEFASMLQYMACMLFQIFCYCWHGNEIIEKSSELLSAPYGSQWVSGSKKIKQSIQIMMLQMKTPLKLVVGGFFTLSIDTFFAEKC